MIATAALVLLIGGAPLLPPPAPMAVGAVPDEPGAFMLPEAPTYQAVAADVDGDGIRDVVRLVAGERDAIDVEVWRHADGAWQRAGPAFNAVPGRPTATQASLVYAGSPARLIVRRVDGAERATLVRQPRFEEPGLKEACCLLLDDVTVIDGVPTLAQVADRGGAADAVLAIDMDGDLTDELLLTRGLPPLGDTTFPTEARVLRWSGDRFAPPVLTRLNVGSGVSPFVLGDSDGVPGDEAAFIGAQSHLHRLSLRAGDVLVAEDGGASVADAVAVPVDDGRGIAILGQLAGLSVRAWARDAALGEPFPGPPLDFGDLLGVVTIRGEPQLLVRGGEVETLMILSLPTLAAIHLTVTRSPAAGTLGAAPARPYVGPFPGGGLDGDPAVVYAGHLIPSEDRPGAAFATSGTALLATLAGTVPLGLVGPDRGWVALWHRALPAPVPDPAGGRLDAPVVQPGSGVSLAPVAAVREPEIDDGLLEPSVDGAFVDRGQLVVGARGFTARIQAAPGSRVYTGRSGGAAIGEVRVVPSSGVLDVPIVPPDDAPPNPRFRATLGVVTPAGHGYLAAWDVRALDAPPPLVAGAETPLGSSTVVISGRTGTGTTVTVAGRPATVDAGGMFRAEVSLPPWPTNVEVVAVDRLGNESRATVSGVGWFDYRALPWLGIALALVGLAGLILYLRVPRAVVEPRRADDDAVLEELDAD